MIRSFTKPCEYKGQVPSLSLMFLAASPVATWSLFDWTPGLLMALVLLAGFGVALGLIAEGCCREAAYDKAEVAPRPLLPRKLLGSLLMGVLVMLLGAAKFSTVLPAIACGLVGIALSLLAFGLDPLRDKGEETPEYLLRQRVQALTRTADRALEDLVIRIQRLEDYDLIRRTDAVHRAVTRLLRTLTLDPLAAEAVHKPLMKFLLMAVHEADRLDDAWLTADRSFARHRYIAKLSAMAMAFEACARHHGLATREDSFELEAELLIDRMTYESVA